jgi:hypothetical protein
MPAIMGAVLICGLLLWAITREHQENKKPNIER